MTLDEFDLKILAALQRDSARTSAELSEIVHLSPSQCSRRKAALEQAGFVQSYHARLDARKLGHALQAITRVNLRDHGEKIAEDFATFLKRHGVVREAFSVSGDADYILKIHARDLDDFADFIHRQLLPHPQVAQVRSDIVLMTLKDDEGVPLDR